MKRCSNVFMYAALFEKILQELYTLFDFVQHPLDMSGMFSFSERCFFTQGKYGGADQGESYTCRPDCSPYKAIFIGKKRRAFFDTLQTYGAYERTVLSTKCHIMQKHWFFWKRYGSFERKVRQFGMHTALHQKECCILERVCQVLCGHCSLNTKCIGIKEGCTYAEEV